MKKAIFALIFLNPFIHGFAQKNDINEQIGLSIPIIWNNTEIFNVYSGARAKYISGSSVSYGININYSRNIFKSIFLIGGIGYYSQNFGIQRPFDFNGDTVTNLLYYTKRYTYSNINWLTGVGYRYMLNKKYTLAGSAVFNGFYTLQQKYSPDATCYSCIKKYQVEKRSYIFGQSFNLNIGASRLLNQKLSIGADLVLPVYTRWRKDKIFRENENEFYNSKFNIGTSLLIKYNFHH
jgi:hypothetical protein